MKESTSARERARVFAAGLSFPAHSKGSYAPLCETLQGAKRCQKSGPSGLERPQVQAAEGQGLLTLLRWRRREPVFPISRSEERTVVNYCSDDRQRNEESRPRPSGLWRKSGQTSFSPLTVGPPQPSGSVSSGRIFAHNAIHPSSVNRPSATCENDCRGQSAGRGRGRSADHGRSRGDRRPDRGHRSRRESPRQGHSQRNSSSRASSIRHSSSQPPTHTLVRGTVECRLAVRRRQRIRERELPGRAPRSNPELRLPMPLPRSTSSCCP